MENDKTLDRYIEGLIESMVAKLDARKRDVAGLLLRDDLELSPKELAVYKWLTLHEDVRVKSFVDERYYKGKKVAYTEIAKELGVSIRTVYSIRRKLIDDLDFHLLLKEIEDSNKNNEEGI